MANRRMFAKTIIDSDAFLDMPLSTQALYFHLSMIADDEGFINAPKKTQRMIGATDDDMRVLIAKNFIIPFETGVVVIKHWKVHNYIQSDRFQKTVYQEEASRLTVKENGAYTIAEPKQTARLQPVSDMYTPCIQAVSTMDTERIHSIGKDRLGKDKLIMDRTGEDDGRISFELTNEEIQESLHRDKEIEDACRDYGLPCEAGHMIHARDLADQYSLEWLLKAIEISGGNRQTASWRYVEGVLRKAKERGGIEKPAPAPAKPVKVLNGQNYEQRQYTQDETQRAAMYAWAHVDDDWG